MTLTHWLGVFDILASLLMLAAGLTITTPFGFASPQKRWALFRRGVYILVTWALFSQGARFLLAHYTIDFHGAVEHLILVYAIVVFPVLRWAGFISQDTFLAFHGSGRAGDRPNDVRD